MGKRRSHAVVFVVAMLAAEIVGAQAPAVPLALQATTFDKIFAFDRSLANRTGLRVLLVFDPAGKDAAVALQRAFAAVAITAEPVPVAAALGRLQPGAVAYLLPGAGSPELLKAMVAKSVLSIAGEAAAAEQGRASVGLAMRGDKAEIVVNVDRAAMEGHDFSAQLLKFARVVHTAVAAVPVSPAAPAPAPAPSPVPAPAAAAGSGEVTPPVLLNISRPEYPPLARRFLVQGDVMMRLSIDASGQVKAVEVVKGVGRGGIDEAAVAAARSATFKPAMRGGTPVAGTYLLTMPFRL